jgi:hypothetical protein
MGPGIFGIAIADTKLLSVIRLSLAEQKSGTNDSPNKVSKVDINWLNAFSDML